MWEFYSYTKGGRLLKKGLQAQAMTMEVGFEYDNKGKLAFMVYPGGKRVKYAYDNMERQTAVKHVYTPAPGNPEVESDLVNGVTYGIAGEMKTMSWLAGTTQWATQSWAFNNRMQMTSYGYSGPGGPVSHSYIYSAANNDGKLWRRRDNVLGEEVEYQYDSIHRLVSAGVDPNASLATAPLWGQSYAYDGFGNLKQKVGHAAAQYTGFDLALNSATNGASPAGDPGDIDNRIVQSGNETYAYAPDNKRVLKTKSAGTTVHHLTLWVGSMRVGTYTNRTPDASDPRNYAVVREDLYIAGRRAAPSDRLGSDVTGGVKLMPYGEDIAVPPVANDRTKFATYHRDETGLDYADQRYYSPGSGRFLTSDPYLASGGASSPGTWNRFAYVSGDPVNKFDPEGLIGYNTWGDPRFRQFMLETQMALLRSAHSQFYSSGPGEGLSGRDREEWGLKEFTTRHKESALAAINNLSEKCQKAFGGEDGAGLETFVNEISRTSFVAPSGLGSALTVGTLVGTTDPAYNKTVNDFYADKRATAGLSPNERLGGLFLGIGGWRWSRHP